MNAWGIPDWLESAVRERDKNCVYCGVQMLEKTPSHGPRGAVATWEHIVNDARIVNAGNIARCCVACNSSKGAKDVAIWLESPYCLKRGITRDSVSLVVQDALRSASRGAAQQLVAADAPKAARR